MLRRAGADILPATRAPLAPAADGARATDGKAAGARVAAAPAADLQNMDLKKKEKSLYLPCELMDVCIFLHTCLGFKSVHRFGNNNKTLFF